jgi:hypothetical protein
MSEYIFQATTYVSPVNSFEYALDAIADLSGQVSFDTLATSVKTYHEQMTYYRVLEVTNESTNETVYFGNLNNYRDQEYEVYSSRGYEIAVLVQADLVFEAYLSLVKTTVILILIMVSTLFISRDATALVLQPLETIMMKVNEMAEDPFQIIKFSEIEAHAQQEDKNKDKVVYETMILDNAITKIGALLLLGFGEAGISLLSDMMGKEGSIDTTTAGK